MILRGDFLGAKVAGSRVKTSRGRAENGLTILNGNNINNAIAGATQNGCRQAEPPAN